MVVKKIMLFVVLLWACFLGGVVEAFGEGENNDLRCRLYFAVGSADLNLGYRDNEWSLKELLHKVRVRQKYSRLERIVITTGASPEGNTANNRRLSDARCEAIRRVIIENMGTADLNIETVSLGEDWDGLARLVEGADDMIFRDEVLEIIRYTPVWVVRDGKIVGSRKQRLMNLYGGTVWRYMERNFFPELRNGSMIEFRFVGNGRDIDDVDDADTEEEETPKVRVVRKKKKQDAAEKDSSEVKTVVVHDTTTVVTYYCPPKPFFLVVKTNLLYDGLTIPNVGAEFWIKDGWTVGGSWEYAWWGKTAKHNSWRVYGGELGVRKYLGELSDKRVFAGHHVGVYGQMLIFDFALGQTGFLAGKPGETLWKKPSFAVGLEYGYSLPINQWMNIDLAVGLGYMGGTLWKYEPYGRRYQWTERKPLRWFGPTKAEVSLVWILGTGDSNR